MKIKKIEIKNFKRFNDLTIEGLEKAKLVLVVGTNGSGKSSLLEACNVWYRLFRKNGSMPDDGYYLKKTNGKNKYIHKSDNIINITFDLLDSSKINDDKVMYFRTAYRNDPDFNINTFERVNKATKDSSFYRMIENDQTVSKNFQRLVSYTIRDVYNEDNDSKKVKDLRDELIGKIKTSMQNVFEDLELNNLGDPFNDGSFYFKKGIVDSFHYKNLSGGEKSAFDLLLDLILKIEEYDDTVFFIDEPETHMHTSLQGKLVKEMYKIIPDNSQLWLTTHSLGIMKMAEELNKKFPESVAILDFSDYNFDETVVIKPNKLDKVLWEKFLSIALDNLANLVAPEYIILCEGSLEGKRRKNFDASIYNIIFNKEYANITFISGGSSNDLEKTAHIGYKLLSSVLETSKIIKLLDRDDKSDEEVEELKKEHIAVLEKRHVEAYLFDDEVLSKLCIAQNKEESIESILNLKNEILEMSEKERGKPKDDIKSSSGEIYNMLKKELNLTQCGNTVDSFMRDTLAPLISSDMEIYKELKNTIFSFMDT